MFDEFLEYLIGSVYKYHTEVRPLVFINMQSTIILAYEIPTIHLALK